MFVVKTEKVNTTIELHFLHILHIRNGKFAVARTSMVVTYYIRLFRKGGDRPNGILMFLLLLIAEIKQKQKKYFQICDREKSETIGIRKYVEIIPLHPRIA